MVSASTFLLNIVWTFCAVTNKKYSSFCSRSECEKRKAIWDVCVAEINQNPDLKKDFDMQMLAVVDGIGQNTQTN
jgi:hypothetical protein